MSYPLKSIVLASAAALLIHNPAFAVDEYNVSKGVTLDGVPLGLRGVDTVALSRVGAVARGTATHTVLHDGNAYYFASKQSAETFTKNPEKYLPQYGGYCAFAVALGKKLDGDPRYADIVDGKLYLFVNDAIFQKYLEDPQKTLKTAEKRWPEIQHKAVGDLL
ncbi:YHS domain-containing (seleno)protein [Elongatibacter sediminis]|uniref:YHS domain-containing (Seleno)protein n=1 Tax=Elongatibacter sediminis TaxID=3119006 RepID=A0AAW9RDE4_9GAMM